MPRGQHKLLSYTEESYRNKLYKRGLNDNQMGTKLGKSREAMRQWRKKNKLKSNNPKTEKEVLNKRYHRYRKGWTDRQMAKADGLSIMAIVVWRGRNGLSTNNA